MHNKTIAVLLIVVGISAITGSPNRGDHDRVLKPPSGAIVVAADVAPLSAVIALDMSDNNTCTQLLSTSTVPYPDLSIPNNSQISWRGAFKNPSPTTLTVQGITIEFAPLSVQSSSIGTPFRNPDGSPKYQLSGPTIGLQAPTFTAYTDYYRFASVVLTGSDGKNYACSNLTMGGSGISQGGVHVQQ